MDEDVHAELEDLRTEITGEVQQLRSEVGELSERMDFAERMLAQNRQAERLPPKAG